MTICAVASLKSRIKGRHAKNRLMGSAKAELLFLDTLQRQPGYGTHQFSVRTKRGDKLILVLSGQGLAVYSDPVDFAHPLDTYEWRKTKNLSYSGIFLLVLFFLFVLTPFLFLLQTYRQTVYCGKWR